MKYDKLKKQWNDEPVKVLNPTDVSNEHKDMQRSAKKLMNEFEKMHEKANKSDNKTNKPYKVA